MYSLSKHRLKSKGVLQHLPAFMIVGRLQDDAMAYERSNPAKLREKLLKCSYSSPLKGPAKGKAAFDDASWRCSQINSPAVLLLFVYLRQLRKLRPVRMLSIPRFHGKRYWLCTCCFSERAAPLPSFYIKPLMWLMISLEG